MGRDGVDSLPGHIGDLDVRDCHQALEEGLAQLPGLDRRRVVLCGGSHCGFLVLHLAGCYLDEFRAVVARNPVTDIATKATITDIPDWNFVEPGRTFQYKMPGGRYCPISASVPMC